MRHAVVVSSAVCFALFFLAACGGPTTPDTEGQSLDEARRTLVDSGVPEGNITVVGGRGDEDELYVCEQEPDGAAPTEPVNLEVAAACAEEDDSSKRKRPKSGRRR